MSTNGLNIMQLPLHSKHVEKGAKFGEFGEWEVPLYYTSILEEHQAVRTKAGLFDISHMGEFFFSGEEVVSFLNELLPRDIGAMSQGQALYMPLLNEEGGIIDDIIVYRFEEKKFLLIVNAGNISKDEAWIRARTPETITFENLTEDMGLLALQGPKSFEILTEAYPELKTSVSDLKYYHFLEWKNGMIARTGYTGEDGYELMVPKAELEVIWDALVGAGRVVPVGFGCRDTLRLEAGMPLCGHDMHEEMSPLEARMSWAIDLGKEKFVGLDVLRQQKEKGPSRKLVGFEMIERGIPREGYEIQKSGSSIGKVTSGTFSPTFKKNIGLGYVSAEQASEDNEIEILIREKSTKAKIVKLPFYKRAK